VRARVSDGVAGYCREQVRRGGGRQLHGAAVTAAAELGRPWLLPSNHDDQSSIPVVNTETPTQLCRDLVPQAGSRSQLEAGELSRPPGATILSSPAASVERTPTTPFILLDDTCVVGQDSSCSRRNCDGGGVGHLSPSPHDCDQKDWQMTTANSQRRHPGGSRGLRKTELAA
jgi:hypothetical protein